MRRTLASIGLMAVGLFIIGFAYLRAARTVDVRSLHPRIADAAWAGYVDRLRGTPPAPGGPMTPLMDAWRAVNRAEVDALVARRLPREDAAYQRALVRFRRAAVVFAQARGGAALADLGRWEGLRLIGALRDLIRYAHHRGSEPGALLSESPRPQPVQAYVDVGGGFVHTARRGGFLTRDALAEDRLPMLQAVFMDHWFGLVHSVRPLDAFEQPDERVWLLRWRLEYQRDAPLASRLAAADALATRPGYPADLNAGVALFEAGEYAEALQRFRRSKARLAPAYARMTRRKLER